MASYYVKYNGVDLTNIMRVRTVNTTVLPPRENNSITIWERPGSIYNAYRYGEREISVTFLIRATTREYNNNPNIMEDRLNTLRNVFEVDKPQPLYLGSTSKFIYAVPDGEFLMDELRYDCYECQINFVCHDPEYYSSNAKSYNSSNSRARAGSNNSIIDIYNSGNASAYPIINVGINSIASFVQVENTTTGNKLLIGHYPSASKVQTGNAEDIILNDDMNNISNWTTNVPYVDSNRDHSGTMKVTSDSSGVMIDSVGGGYSIWHGVSARQNLNRSLADFSVRAKMTFNSTSKNGDPDVPILRDDIETVFSGSKYYYYKVSAPSVNVKNVPNGTIIGSLEKGAVVIPQVTRYNGHIGIEYDGVIGYCDASYLRKYVSDATNTNMAMNVVTNNDIELRSYPNNDSSMSKILATIPGGTPIRVYKENVDGFYKLYITYNGKVGYIDASKVTPYDAASVDYPEDEIIVPDDYKTGVCEVYGYSASGTKLFKLSLVDDNKYYEFTKPFIDIGNQTVLEDTSSVPKNNKVEEIEESIVTFDYLAENESIGWNDFYGELGIQRKNGKWQGWVYKMINGSAANKLIFKEQKVSGAPEEPLAFITIYMGTENEFNMNGMSISYIQVDSLNNLDPSIHNVNVFKPGDELKIDCYNNKVYLNNKLYNDIDVGSQFIELKSGDNNIKVTSDDMNVVTTILFNERYL